MNTFSILPDSGPLAVALGLTLAVVMGGCEPRFEKIDRREDPQAAVDRGRELYFSHGCAVCHGKDGRGDGLAASGAYPPPINFRDPEAYRQGSTVDEIRRSIKNGSRRPDSVMPSYGHLPDEELHRIALYIQSLQVKRDEDPAP